MEFAMNKYRITMAMVDENLELLKSEVYIFAYKGRKASGISARNILLNLKKLCHSLRKEIGDDLKNRVIVKRTISPESLEAAKIKRQKTVESKKRQTKK
jgi:hypothetical protein